MKRIRHKRDDPVKDQIMNGLGDRGVETVNGFLQESGVKNPTAICDKLHESYGLEKEDEVSHLLDLIAEAGSVDCLSNVWIERNLLEIFLDQIVHGE